MVASSRKFLYKFKLAGAVNLMQKSHPGEAIQFIQTNKRCFVLQFVDPIK